MEERKSIGIFGVQQGVGVTHLCTALTHYCADCLKSHTALVELSGNHELEELQKQQQGKWGRPDRKHYFAMREVIICRNISDRAMNITS